MTKPVRAPELGDMGEEAAPGMARLLVAIVRSRWSFSARTARVSPALISKARSGVEPCDQSVDPVLDAGSDPSTHLEAGVRTG